MRKAGRMSRWPRIRARNPRGYSMRKIQKRGRAPQDLWHAERVTEGGEAGMPRCGIDRELVGRARRAQHGHEAQHEGDEEEQDRGVDKGHHDRVVQPVEKQA